MVYAGKVGARNASLGVSGRLDGRDLRNLIMWDAETNSLWSQLKGEAIYGTRKGERLQLLPAILVGFGTWKSMHPKSLVLNLTPVRRREWYYQAMDMARGHVRVRTRSGGRRKLALGIGVRRGTATLLVSNNRIRAAGVVQAELAGTPLVFVWLAEHGVPLVYDRRPGGRGAPLDFRLAGGRLRAGKRVFDPLRGRCLAGDGVGARRRGDLLRHSYIPTYVEAWRGYYPNGRVLAGSSRPPQPPGRRR